MRKIYGTCFDIYFCISPTVHYVFDVVRFGCFVGIFAIFFDFPIKCSKMYPLVIVWICCI